MKDNIVFKLIRAFRKPFVQTATKWSDGIITIGPDNPSPLTRNTKFVEEFRTERSPRKSVDISTTI